MPWRREVCASQFRKFILAKGPGRMSNGSPALSPHRMRREGGFSRVRGVPAHDVDRKFILAKGLAPLIPVPLPIRWGEGGFSRVRGITWVTSAWWWCRVGPCGDSRRNERLDPA